MPKGLARRSSVASRRVPSGHTEPLAGRHDGNPGQAGQTRRYAREQTYKFAHGCLEHGEPEYDAAAVICFE